MAKYLLVLLNIALFMVIVHTEVPSYVHVCGRRNPKLNECVKSSVEALREKLKTGLPEFNAPAIEPLEIPGELVIADSEEFKAKTKNIKVYGIYNFQINSLNLDIEKHTLDLDLFIKKMKLEGDYDINAKIIVPINLVGPILIDSDDVNAKASANFQIITRKNGNVHMIFTSMKIKLTIRDYVSHFVPKSGEDSTFAEAINEVLNSSKQEIIASISGSLEKAAGAKILEVANKIGKSFTYDELLPDRE